jgi:hypothetical protein
VVTQHCAVHLCAKACSKKLIDTFFSELRCSATTTTSCGHHTVILLVCLIVFFEKIRNYELELFTLIVFLRTPPKKVQFVAETSESTRHGAPAGYLPNPPATASVVDGVSVSTQRLLAGGDYAVGVRRAIAAPVLLDHPCLQHCCPSATHPYTRLPDVHISSKSYRRSGTAGFAELVIFCIYAKYYSCP